VFEHDAWESLGQRLDSLKAQAASAPGREALVAAVESLAHWAEAASSLGAAWAPLAEVEARRLLAGAQAGRPDAQLRQRLNEALDSHAARLQESVPNPTPVSPAAANGHAAKAASKARLAVNADDLPMFHDFLGEAPQLLQVIETGLLELSKGSLASLPELLRSLHTLKGIFGFLGMPEMNSLCHRCEDVLDPYKQEGGAVPTGVLAWLLSACDFLSAQVRRVDQGLASGSIELVDLSQLAPAPAQNSEAAPAPATQAAPSLEAEAPAAAQIQGDRSIRVRAEKMDALLELAGELAICQAQVGEGLRNLELPPAVGSEVQRLNKISRELQESVLGLRLVPVEPLFLKASRMAHDLSLKIGKPVDFTAEGGETELDKGVVEELSEPLLHLIRNAVDHGLEDAQGRAQAGKEPQGHIRLSARRDGRDFVLELSDDGRGLDYAALEAKGLERGLLEPGAQHDAERLTRLIFEPGFSTAKELSDVSGRGVGMDAVKRKVLSLKGSIQVASEEGKGCSFIMRFPLTLSLMDGILVASGGQRYVLPASQILQFMSAQETQRHRVGQGEEAWLEARQQSLPLIDLGNKLNASSTTASAKAQQVALVVESLGRQAALLVDEVLGKQQVVAKSLGTSLQDLKGIAGGAILGDGRVSLILDLEALMGR
jgi:two-component system chemotaxis sensor kinase CheA